MTKTVINTGTDTIVIFLFASATIDTLSVTDTVTGSFLLSGFLLEQALIATCFCFWILLVLHLCMLLVLFVTNPPALAPLEVTTIFATLYAPTAHVIGQTSV